MLSTMHFLVDDTPPFLLYYLILTIPAKSSLHYLMAYMRALTKSEIFHRESFCVNNIIQVPISFLGAN